VVAQGVLEFDRLERYVLEGSWSLPTKTLLLNIRSRSGGGGELPESGPFTAVPFGRRPRSGLVRCMYVIEVGRQVKFGELGGLQGGIRRLVGYVGRSGRLGLEVESWLSRLSTGQDAAGVWQCVVCGCAASCRRVLKIKGETQWISSGKKNTVQPPG